MPSSTSHSNRAWRKLWLTLLLTLAGALALAAFYTVRLNPEVRHFLGTHAIKQAWAASLTERFPHKVVVYGGSSCEFSIDGERLLTQHQIPCANLGRGAGMGTVVLTMAALEELREGDTLVVALEPGLLTDPLEVPNLGIQFSLASGHGGWVRDPLPPAKPVGRVASWLALRPGGMHVFTMLGKLLRGQPLYRYRLEDTQPSGYATTPLRLDIQGPPGHGGVVPDLNLAFLHSLRAWCEARKVRVAYAMPWAYTPAEVLDATRRDNAALLLQLCERFPVLKDPRLGAYEVRTQFADTAWHLTPEGAALRTDAFAAQLQSWELWTPETLRPYLEGSGPGP